ncbi:MAG: Arc family DNA-binding protein [Mesorhizobium sp.]|uniref:Arc family DNA-binding protein n=1 Tax=Mesorhizobium sp. TaxID=1871066 RepID=UPI000FE6CC6D|nr:Arc family DNA-binding protein [Mesorhizobium sp.]RWL21949.1 MAG: Arc family DNA-binding protein [Mesorhizobium sp.]
MPPQDRTTIHIRITPSLLKRLKIAAAEGERSMNAEVAARLERSFTDDDDNRVIAVRLLTEAASILDKGKA